MPVIQRDPSLSSYLVYNAPLDEKTKKLREEFNIDEETGYPEQYKWRNMAKLGHTYKPEDPFIKFENDSGYDIGRLNFMLTTSTLLAYLCHHFKCIQESRPVWSRPIQLLVFIAMPAATIYYGHKWSSDRMAKRNGIIVDYLRKHPERFDDVQRYKFREVLHPYYPRR